MNNLTEPTPPLKSSTTSLAGRALLALVLMVGFYILAMGIVVGLLYIPYAEVVYANRLHIKLALGCGLSAILVFWSVLPRVDKFESPGPRLNREQQPKLFEEIEQVAKSVHQAMPAEVYLLPDVNAWVAQRGGIMGFGSRRVMGLGLPLMRMLTRSQFRAVLAHEFGHYHGGDTRLGPWIYRTRGAIGRTLQSLGDGSLVQLPFLWYGKMFLRITHAVSRRQEFVADELAARAVGSQALIGGLRTVHGIAPAFQAYWFQEFVPVLSAGYRPPFMEGFQKFVQAGQIAQIIDSTLDEELKSAETNPYDTHPPLRERIAAVEHLPTGSISADDPPAATLLANLAEVEQELVTGLLNTEVAGKLKSIDWNAVGEVYMPQWKALVKANTSALTGMVPEALPRIAANVSLFARRVRNVDGTEPAETESENLAVAVIGGVLTLLLVQRGGGVQSLPGQPVSVTIAATVVEPFMILRSLADGKTTAEAWQTQCAGLGIRGVDLSTFAASL